MPFKRNTFEFRHLSGETGQNNKKGMGIKMEQYFEPALLADVIANMQKQGDTAMFEAQSDNFGEDYYIMEF